MPLELLHLLQLADSALPVGGMAHSFGLESLVEFGFLQPEGLECFLRDWLAEAGSLEAAFCARACAEPREFDRLNLRLCARKPARESREGSAAMGRRLLDLAARAYGIAPLTSAPNPDALLPSRDRGGAETRGIPLANTRDSDAPLPSRDREGADACEWNSKRNLDTSSVIGHGGPPLPHGHGSVRAALQGEGGGPPVMPASDGADTSDVELQYPCCFGYVAAVLGVPPDTAVAAFLHQAVAALISSCQRLMPLGHTHAQAILFRLKPQIAAVAAHAVTAGIDIPSFTPLVETASMCHARLATRLFIS